MKRSILASALVVSACLSLLLLSACGGKAKSGEACEKQSDCERGMICFNAKCEAPGEDEKVAPAEAEEKAEAAGSADSDTWEVFRVARDVKEPYLMVRAKRTSKSKHVAKLPEGTTVKVLETKGKWRNIEITSGEDKGTKGWSHICCMKPKGAKDLYWARLGADDHANSSGKPIESAPGILRQDRANYHKFDRKDRDDRDDDLYDDKGARAKLSKMLKESLDKETKRIIHKHQPLVQVVTYEDRIDVSVIEKGPKHEMTWDEAEALCMRRYCKCVTGKGKCKHKRYEKCMMARGHDTGGHGCGRNY